VIGEALREEGLLAWPACKTHIALVVALEKAL